MSITEGSGNQTSPHMASEGQPLTQSFMRNSGEKVEDTYTVATKAISSITCARYKMYSLGSRPSPYMRVLIARGWQIEARGSFDLPTPAQLKRAPPRTPAQLKRARKGKAWNRGYNMWLWSRHIHNFIWQI